jgi:Family of unknown function (DUF6459)
MTTSAPQWPGQEGSEVRREEQDGSGRPTLIDAAVDASRVDATPTGRPDLQVVPDEAGRRLRTVPGPSAPEPEEVRQGSSTPDEVGQGPAAPAEMRQRKQERPAPGRRFRLVGARDLAERELRAARRRARVNLPPPGAVTRDLALALLEVEAGCRSAAQLERVFSPELWEALEHRIGRRGGPLPSGRSVMSVRCQEHWPGLADTVAVVRKGEVVRPVALRLDAGGGRWVVTELRWWRNETDTATTPGRDGGSS